MSTRSGQVALRARRGHKERSKNFTEAEKRTVLELIARHRDVLRQGRSNNATNRSKQLVWSTICEEVNKRCGGDRPRTPAQVKMWYENYKKKCKMRAHDTQHQQPEAPSLLDGMLWQTIHPLDVAEDDGEGAGSGEALSVKDEDCLPVNMSNGRLSSTLDSDDTPPNVLEPHVQILPQSPPAPPHPLQPPLHPIEQVRLHQNLSYLQKLSSLSNTPLNLSQLEDDRRNGHDHRHETDHKRPDATLEQGFPKYDRRNSLDYRHKVEATDEERLYFSARRQHAIWEHEAKMKILNMELRQKEEIFSLQKQLFLIELKLKMDFLEKASGK